MFSLRSRPLSVLMKVLAYPLSSLGPAQLPARSKLPRWGTDCPAPFPPHVYQCSNIFAGKFAFPPASSILAKKVIYFILCFIYIIKVPGLEPIIHCFQDHWQVWVLQLKMGMHKMIFAYFWCLAKLKEGKLHSQWSIFLRHTSFRSPRPCKNWPSAPFPHHLKTEPFLKAMGLVIPRSISICIKPWRS